MFALEAEGASTEMSGSGAISFGTVYTV